MVYTRVSDSRWVNASPIEEQNDRRRELLGAKVQYLKYTAIEIGEVTKRQIARMKVQRSSIALISVNGVLCLMFRNCKSVQI